MQRGCAGLFSVAAECSASERPAWNKLGNFFLPAATLKNSCRICIFSILHCIYGEKYTSPRYFSEKIAEWHYSRVKKEFRGSPSIREGVMATQKQHLCNLKSQPSPPTLPTSDMEAPLSLQRAQHLVREALKASCLFQSFITVQQVPSDVAKELKEWWQSFGHSLFTKDTCQPDEIIEEGLLSHDVACFLHMSFMC